MTATLSPPQQQPAAQTVEQSLFPMDGETQGQFFDRAWRALKKQYPEANCRTPAILKIWRASQNDADLRRKAAERFTPDKFTRFGPRCIFLSHTIPPVAEMVDDAGEVTRRAREGTEYNRENLEKLVTYANYRIRNADQFAALSEGHMPTMEEKATGRPDAEVLGYAGPFYIGLFGNVDPKWSIWSDEWVHNEDVPKAEKLQRRSPEIWCKEPIERRTMDPIAMLGSETPRLDSGMNLYSLRSDGQEVMRYSMGMCLPGPDNSFVPGSESGKKQKYGAADMADPNMTPPGNTPPGTAPVAEKPSLEDSIAQAIAQLMPNLVQIVGQLQKQGDGNDPDSVPDDNQDDDSDAADIPRGIDAPPEGGEKAPYASDSPPQTNAAPVAATAVATPPTVTQPLDEDHKKYAAMSPDCGMAYAAGHAAGSQKGRPMTTNYSKQFEDQAAEIAQLRTRAEAQAKRIADLEQTARDTERYAKIHSIAMTHEIGDEESHLKDLMEVGDLEFDRYCKALTLAPKKGDVVETEFFDDPSLDPEKEMYALRQTNARANSKKVPTKEEIDQYMRQAADQVVRKNGKTPGTTTLEAERDIIFKAHGIAV